MRAGAVALGLALLAGASVVPGKADAQVLLGKHRAYNSPQNFAFELRFGPYRPDVDSEFEDSGQTPYRDYFGSSRRLMSQIEIDWQFFKRFGTLGIGAGLGYFTVSGNAPAADGTSRLTADKSTFKVVPLSISLVYRLDVVYLTTGIPLVPYAKAGLDYAYWSITDGNGDIATDGGTGRGRGGTPGWHGALGVSLVLDFIDPDAARTFDVDLGVNHTHLFFEMSRYDISGLGSGGKLHVGDTTWLMGLLFEF